MDELKSIKIENIDGVLSDEIPIGVNAANVTIDEGGNKLDKYIKNNDSNISSLKDKDNNLQSQINNNIKSIQNLASGSPKGTYESVEKLISANPESGVYIITNNGHIYSYEKNSSKANDLGIYQSTGLKNNSIYKKHFAFDYQDRFIPEGTIIYNSLTHKVTIPSRIYYHSNNTDGWGAMLDVSSLSSDYPNGEFTFTLDDLSTIYFDYQAAVEGKDPFIVCKKATFLSQQDDRYEEIFQARYRNRICI